MEEEARARAEAGGQAPPPTGRPLRRDVYESLPVSETEQHDPTELIEQHPG